MNKKLGLFWLRDDFRTSKNYGLIEATRNHEQVVVFYLYKELIFVNKKLKNGGLLSLFLIFKKAKRS